MSGRSYWKPVPMMRRSNLNGGLAGHLNGVLGQVDGAHHRLVVDLETLRLVVLLAQQDQPVEGVDLLAVHVRNATRAVGNVLQLGEDDDTSVGIYLLRGAGSTHAGRTSADDHDGVRHRFVPSAAHGPRQRRGRPYRENHAAMRASMFTIRCHRSL